jgi:hypothetical protein
MKGHGKYRWSLSSKHRVLCQEKDRLTELSYGEVHDASCWSILISRLTTIKTPFEVHAVAELWESFTANDSKHVETAQCGPHVVRFDYYAKPRTEPSSCLRYSEEQFLRPLLLDHRLFGPYQVVSGKHTIMPSSSPPAMSPRSLP